MDFSNIKFIASDMDGTLLNSRHELSPAFFPIFEALKARGILFAAASGRQYQNLVKVLAPIKEEVVFLAENGSYVMYQGQELLVRALEPEIVPAIVQKARTIPNAYLVLCGKKSAYVESTHPDFMAQLQLYYDQLQVVDDLLKVENDQFLKLAICDLAGAELNSNTYFQKEREYLQVTVSGKVWLDLCHQDANKGEAMKVVQKKFGITARETMAFGDFLNDLKMLQEAHYSYAMQNAHPDIKAAARYQAKSNDQDGVLEVLQQVLNR
ncbi:MAG: HAD family hydrolase [Rufibacter sp.]